MKYLLSLFFALSFFILDVNAQSKKAMTPDTYLEWNRIKSEQISNNGDWVKYHLQTEKGDASLKIYNTRAETTYTFDRVGKSSIGGDSRYVFFLDIFSF